jgi:hypothetical protein
MSRGYVYVLTNPTMPGLVKIGITTRSVAGRANELYQTGVPMPFKVSFEIKSPDCIYLERLAHERFSSVRVNDSREFFAATVIDVSKYLQDEMRYQVECLVDEYIPEQMLVPMENFVDLGAFKQSFYKSVSGNDLLRPELINALYQIEGHEFEPAISREKAAAQVRIADFKASRDADRNEQ